MGFRAAQHAYEMQDGSNADEDRKLRFYEGQQQQMERDPDYFGEQIFEHGVTSAEAFLIGRALDAYTGESLAVDELRNRIATLNAEHMAKHRRLFG